MPGPGCFCEHAIGAVGLIMAVAFIFIPFAGNTAALAMSESERK
jgi:hypothetical protein